MMLDHFAMTTGVMLHRRVGSCCVCVANSSASTYPSVLRPNKRLQLNVSAREIVRF